MPAPRPRSPRRPSSAAAVLGSLLPALAPVVRREIGAVLRRHFPARWRARAAAEVEDLTQELWLQLLEDDGRRLRGWRSERGRTLLSYVRLLSRHHALSALRRRAFRAWESPTSAGPLEQSSLEQRVSARCQLQSLLEDHPELLQGQGARLFEALFLDERAAPELAPELGTTVEAIYAWRFRVRARARRWAARAPRRPQLM